jgi:hypothetical protein
MTADPVVQERKESLKREAMLIIETIRTLGQNVTGDPLLNVETLAKAVEIGLLDAPNLRGNPHACGRIRTRALDGAIVAIDENGHLLPERKRVARFRFS